MMRIGLRGAVATALLAFGVAGAVAQDQQPASLAQGWSADERQWFYTVSQGSQMMPYSWFIALERAADDRPFAGELASWRASAISPMPTKAIIRTGSRSASSRTSIRAIAANGSA